MATKTTISAAMALSILTATLLLTATSDRCTSLWEETNQPNIYYCSVEDNYQACGWLSSSKLTCYLMKDPPLPIGDLSDGTVNETSNQIEPTRPIFVRVDARREYVAKYSCDENGCTLK